MNRFNCPDSCTWDGSAASELCPVHGQARQRRAEALRMARREGYHYSRRNQRHEFRPGRFESEWWPVAYFYNAAMNGDGEPIGTSEWQEADIFEIDAIDRAAFDLAADIVAVAVTYSEAGFIGLLELTAAELEAARN